MSINYVCTYIPQYLIVSFTVHGVVQQYKKLFHSAIRMKSFMLSHAMTVVIVWHLWALGTCACMYVCIWVLCVCMHVCVCV